MSLQIRQSMVDRQNLYSPFVLVYLAGGGQIQRGKNAQFPTIFGSKKREGRQNGRRRMKRGIWRRRKTSKEEI
jgi:hypothetical protein